MDDLLDRLSREYLQAKAKNPELTVQDFDEWAKAESQGKYDFAAVKAHAGRVSPGNLLLGAAQGAGFGLVDDVAGAFSPELGARLALQSDTFRNESPIASLFTELAGSLVPGVGAAKAGKAMFGPAKTLLEGVGRGMVAGGAAGAAAGYGNAPEGDKLAGTVFGATMGTALGAAAPAGAAAVGSIRGRDRAANRLADAAAKDGVTAASAKATLAEAKQLGRPMMVADLGENLRGAADFAATNSPEAFAKMRKPILQRALNEPSRLLDDAYEILGPTAAKSANALKDVLEQSRQAWADSPAGFEGLRKANPRVDIGRLREKLRDAPLLAKPWRDSQMPAELRDHAAWDLVEGGMPQAAKNVRVGQGAPPPVSFATLHDFRRRLNQYVDVAFKAGNGEAATALKSFRNALDDALVDAVPGYQKVKAEYATRKGLERAIDIGQELYQADRRTVSETWKTLTPGQREVVRRTMASEFIGELNAARSDYRILGRLTSRSKDLDATLKTVFGSKAKFDEMTRRMGFDEMMRETNAAVTGSPTARRKAASEAIDPVGATADILQSGSVLPPVRRDAGTFLRRATTERTANRMADPLMISDPAQAQQFFESLGQRKSPFGFFPTLGAPTMGAAMLPGILGGRHSQP